MNPPIFVQPSNVITVGPIGDVEPGIVTDSKSKQVAAIIRPVARVSGNEGSLRIDGANSTAGKTHLRSEQLQDYVNWLLDRIEADSKESNSHPQTDELPSLTPDNRPTTTDPTSNQSPSPAPDSLPAQSQVTNPTIDTASSRLLAPADSEIQTVPAASDFYFSTISTDMQLAKAQPAKEILATSMKAESIVETAAPPTQRPAQGFSIQNTNRIDKHHGPEVVLPAAHLPFTEDQSIQETSLKQTAEGSPDPTSETRPVAAEGAESFISMVSKAIASVLTERSEPEFEQKIRSHFESELHSRVVETMVSKPSSAPVKNEPTDQTESLSKPLPTPKMKLEAEKIAAGILSESRKEIPSYVAAWDVEDFRWPAVTNRMIVAGGDAIGRLSTSVFESITHDHQRVAITGLGRGEGTSSIAISLARWSAACGKKVLLVDGDIASPTLGTDIGLAPNLSWINAVSQSLPAAEAIVRSQKTNLCVMPMAKMVSRVTWPRFIFDNLGELINNVRSHFDLVILDLGPASQLLAELSRPEYLIDSTLLVHDGVVTPDFNETRSRLESFGLKKLMIAQNRARKTKANVA